MSNTSPSSSVANNNNSREEKEEDVSSSSSSPPEEEVDNHEKERRRIQQQQQSQNQQITLSDGRKLGFAEYIGGCSTTTTTTTTTTKSSSSLIVIYCHGGNGSRYEGEWFEEALIKQEQQQQQQNLNNIRLIVPDRPGFGLSDFKKDRKILDWVDDLLELIDYLNNNDNDNNNNNNNKFSIFGLSGGAPYVAACAYKIPHRLYKIAIISGVTPPQHENKFIGMWLPIKIIFWTAKYFPTLNKFLLKQQSQFYASDIQTMHQRMISVLPKPDITLFETRPEILQIFCKDAQESHRHGINGDVYEWQLYVNDWGFTIDNIQEVKEIALWYGLYDTNTPIGMGIYYYQQLLLSANQNNNINVIFHQVEDGGHFSTINNHIGNILKYLSSSSSS